MLREIQPWLVVSLTYISFIDKDHRQGRWARLGSFYHRGPDTNIPWASKLLIKFSDEKKPVVSLSLTLY
jgi:hypothetical protein